MNRRFEMTMRAQSERGSRVKLPFAGLLVGALAVSLMACGTGAPVGEDSAAITSSIERNEILTRGKSWLDEKVPYSQSATHTNKFGTYRTDCSGYVSMAWGLKSSLTTHTLPGASTEVSSDDLQPGDALIKNSDGTNHAALFVRWEGDGKPVVWEEYTSGRTAEEREWDSLRGYTGYRHNSVSGTASAAAGDDGDDGDREGSEDGLPVLITWNGVANTEASINLLLKAKKKITKCIGVEVLREEFERGISDGLGYLFTGECVSKDGLKPDPADIIGFELCSTNTEEDPDFEDATCTKFEDWDHTSNIVHIDNPGD